MRSFANNFISKLRNLSAGSAEVKCICRPSPPGGITRCEGGQIAVCGDGGTGICEGRCVSIDPNLVSLDYAAELLSEVLQSRVEASDLEDNAHDFGMICRLMLESSGSGKTVNFNLGSQQYHVCVGLTRVAKTKLGETVSALAQVPQRQPAY